MRLYGVGEKGGWGGGGVSVEELEKRTKAMKLPHMMNGLGKRGVVRGPGRPSIHIGSMKLD